MPAKTPSLKKKYVIVAAYNGHGGNFQEIYSGALVECEESELADLVLELANEKDEPVSEYSVYELGRRGLIPTQVTWVDG